MSTELDRIKRGLDRFIRARMTRVDRYALYPSRVVAQDNGGNLELVPDDTRIGSLQGVPIRLGLPQASVKVASGSRVLLGWENGDPRRPYAGLWDVSTVTELKLNGTQIILNGGSAAVGRVGDAVQVTIAQGAVMIPDPVTGSPVPNPAPMPVNGQITAGAPGVKA